MLVTTMFLHLQRDIVQTQSQIVTVTLSHHLSVLMKIQKWMRTQTCTVKMMIVLQDFDIFDFHI